MGQNIVQKIIAEHLICGEMTRGNEVGIKIDQTLIQDPTGIMALLQFEAMDVDRVRTEKSLIFIDHNTLQTGYESADDHRYIYTMAKKYGIDYSGAGNGICHQVYLERFAKPGKTLLGGDSHTSTCGGMGMLGIGAGGLEIAMAMGGGTYYLIMPEIVKINLIGKLQPWVAAKDIILEVLRRMTVKGGVGKILEYGGEGTASLTVPERATITNMGAELGATASLFPADEQTRTFLRAQRREAEYRALGSDPDASYDGMIEIDLRKLVPLVACPHSPDNVKTVIEAGKIRVSQVCIGSCTNSSYLDLMKTANILKGKGVCPGVSLAIAPGSKQVLSMLAENGALADLVDSGARILECACGPCVGMGFSPPSGGAVSLRTFNRNFEGRSGTADAQVYLVSPETAAVSALRGELTDPRTLGEGEGIEIRIPEQFKINDNMIEPPAPRGHDVSIIRGPNIKPFPIGSALPETVTGKTLLKVGDHITTDHIMPAGAKLLPFRANIPYLADYCFSALDQNFPKRAREWKGGFIAAGMNYGQGSSRESAALVPLYLGVKGIIAKSFARIHYDNLINSGILPLTFSDPSDYENMDMGDDLVLEGIREKLRNKRPLTVQNVTRNRLITISVSFTDRQTEIILAGGLLNHTKQTSR